MLSVQLLRSIAVPITQQRPFQNGILFLYRSVAFNIPTHDYNNFMYVLYLQFKFHKLIFLIQYIKAIGVGGGQH